MKKLIINNLINNIKKNCNYDKIKVQEIKYGLESLYLSITKITIILLISLLIGNIKELLFIFLFYGLLRLTGFGLHTKTTKQCWISSIIIFIGIPYLVDKVAISKFLLLPISILLLTLIILYAPADTEKRPIINKKKRLLYKIITSLIALIYLFISYNTKSIYLQNILLFSVIIEVFVIVPISYKLFNLKYDNYKYYKKGGSICHS